MNLEPYKARLAAATPGPWETYDERPSAVSIMTSQTKTWVGMTFKKTDATLIAHAPTDIAELVAEVERLQAVIDAVSELLDLNYYQFASAGDVLSDLSAALEMKEKG